MSFELEDDGRGRRKQAAPLKGISAAAQEVELEDAVAELVEVGALPRGREPRHDQACHTPVCRSHTERRGTGRPAVLARAHEVKVSAPRQLGQLSRGEGDVQATQLARPGVTPQQTKLLRVTA